MLSSAQPDDYLIDGTHTQHITLLTLLCNLSALLAGFSTIFLAQVTIPPTDVVIGGDTIITIFSLLSVIVICLNIISLTITTCILLYAHSTIHQFATDTQLHDNINTQYIMNSLNRYKSDIYFAYKCFLSSIPLFIINVAFLGFIQFHSSSYAPYVITVISGMTATYTCVYTIPKYNKSIKMI